MKEIILASQSPRRKQLLAAMGVDFDVVPSRFDEQLDDTRSPQEVAAELALGKAMEVARTYPNSLVVGSDTIVTVDGKQLEKPRDDADAKAMLQSLSGRPNDVTTSVAVVRLADNTKLVDTDTTRVYFKPYDQAAVDAYVATGDTRDKAGAYGIQSGAAALISYIEGDYDTVVGLPTRLLASMFARVGVSSEPVELESPVEQRKTNA